MKKLFSPSIFFSSIFFFLVLMSSFSLDYSREDSREDKPPITQKENRRNLRLEKKQNRLKKRLKKAKHSVKRQKIQKKIRSIKQKKDDGFGTPIVGIIGMIFSILAFILFIAFIAALIAVAVGSFGVGAVAIALPMYLGIAGAGSAVTGLIVSIVGLVLNKKDPDKFTQKGFAIAGMVIGSVMTGIFIFALALYFAFL